MTSDDAQTRHTHRHNALLGSIDLPDIVSRFGIYRKSLRFNHLALALATCAAHVALVCSWASRACTDTSEKASWMSLWTVVPISISVLYVTLTGMGSRYADSNLG